MFALILRFFWHEGGWRLSRLSAHRRRLFVLPLLLLIASCTSLPEEGPETVTAASQSAEPESPSADDVPRSRRIYFFQHRLMPQWLFESDGGFYEDMMLGYRMSLRDAAAEVVDEDFAAYLQIEYNETYDAVLFSFESPDSPPNCFFVALKKTDDGYRYFTFERTVQLDEEDEVTGVVGEWLEAGNRANLGPRSYQTLEAFADDLFGGEY